MAEHDSQLSRIRNVFGLSNGAPVPRVNRDSLRRYYEYLIAHLAVPFDALYADTRPPVRQLVRHLRVVRVLDMGDHLTEGLICEVQESPKGRHLPLSELGVREDDPNYELLDDYAFWFLNSQ